jgi:2-polyprenyl-6-methoxyphenol hydroxylase-like FAD-dependent oxidoreductase
MRILIVGGGIGGLSLAAALAGRGLACDVVEREPAWTTVGAGITLYPNGIRAFGALGLADAVVAAGCPVTIVRTLDIDGNLLAESPGESWPDAGPTLAIHRADLQRVLLGAIGDLPVRMATTVTALAQVGDGVDASFSDGTRSRYDVIVGADGIRSAVRALCFEDTPPRYVGQMYWRTATSTRIVDTATLQFADNRFVALMPLGADLTYLAFQVHCPEPFDEPPGGVVVRLRERFGDFAGPSAAALDALEPGDQPVHLGPAEEVARDVWRAGRVVLIGDAAHACSPTLAQGGSLAVEDAVVLAELLAGERDPDAALEAFVARREPRARWVRERTDVHIGILNSGGAGLAERWRETYAELAQPI